ncbi:MAG: DUF924 family protein [Sulfuriferula sp.]
MGLIRLVQHSPITHTGSSFHKFGSLHDTEDMTEVVRYAHRHHEVIARFGRFPHRNAIVGPLQQCRRVGFFTAARIFLLTFYSDIIFKQHGHN